MRVVVVGATGNIGTSLLAALAADDTVESVLGLARRTPELALRKVTWARTDVVTGDLGCFRGADAVVHLAWSIQPSRDEQRLRTVNVGGSARVFRAAGLAGVPVLVYGSSVGAYSPGPKDRAVDEGWPVDGVATSFYGRHKAEVERRLDGHEREFPEQRVVRMRPGLVFKHGAASGIRRLFAGPLLPTRLLDTGRARSELGWAPRKGADEALLELLAGLRENACMPTPPLDRSTGGPLRARELASGIGSRGGRTG
jgi:nucleoside-diphosphate-sugar epimerase